MADGDIKALQGQIDSLKAELALRSESAEKLFNSKNEAMDKRLSWHIKLINIVYIGLASVIAIIAIFLTVFSVGYIKKKADLYAERSVQKTVKTLVDKHEKFLEARLATMENRIEFNLWYQKGELELKSGKYNDAIIFFKNALKNTEDPILSAYSHHGIGLSYKYLGNYDKAFENYDDAIGYKEDYAYAYQNRGFIYSQYGQYDKAIEDYNVMAKLFINENNYENALVGIRSMENVAKVLKGKDMPIKEKAERFIRERKNQLEEAKKKGEKIIK